MKVTHEKVIEGVLSGKSQTQAYKEAYGGENMESAAASASRLLGSVRVRERIKEILRNAKIDETMIAQTLLELRNSPDWRARCEFIDRVAKFLGLEDEEDNDEMPTFVFRRNKNY